MKNTVLIKVISLTLTFLLLAGMSCLSLSAGAAGSPTIALKPAGAVSGGKVNFNVTISDNPGIIALRVFVEYDKAALRLVKAENGSLFAKNTSTFGDNYDVDPYAMLWADSTATVDMVQNGVLAVLTFEVVDASAAATSQIRLSYDEKSTFNKDLTEVTFTTKGAAISDYRPDATVSIRNFTSSRTETYKTSITFGASAKNAPEGSSIHWFIDGKDCGTGETYKVSKAKKTYTVQVRLLDKDGQELASSGVETVNINARFFVKVKAFFQTIFHLLPDITQ